MRKVCQHTIYELAKEDPRIFYIGSDLGIGTLQEFKDEMPDRFFMEGISEANVIGMAAGLALEGKIPYVNTIGTFLTRRCFDQIVVDVCLHNLPVRLVSQGGGFVYAPLGPTHMAIEDIAIMRAIPNMSIIAPSDAEQMRILMRQTADYPGPLFIRLAKGGDKVVTPIDTPLKIGEAWVAKKGKDVLLVTTGITLQIALEAADELSKDNISATVLHMHTVKPFDHETLLKMAEPTKVIITVEEHTIMGGLGSASAEILAESGMLGGKTFCRIGLPDTFTENYGSQADLLRHYDITTDNVVKTTKAAFK